MSPSSFHRPLFPTYVTLFLIRVTIYNKVSEQIVYKCLLDDTRSVTQCPVSLYITIQSLVQVSSDRIPLLSKTKVLVCLFIFDRPSPLSSSCH